MGLHLLNISVDTADLYPEYIPEDLSINDQESIVEIVLEKVLGYEDAIKEYDDHDTEDHNKKTNVEIDLTTQCIAEIALNQKFITTARQSFPNDDTLLATGFNEIASPPPKV